MSDEVIQPDAAITPEGEVIELRPAAEPKLYNVAWIMNNIEAHSPEEAALRARAIQVDPEFSATVFMVFTPDGMQKAVNIADVIRLTDEPSLLS